MNESLDLMRAKEFTTNKGRKVRMVSRKSKWANGEGCYKIQVEFEEGWKTVVPNCYGGLDVKRKVIAEY